MEWSPDMIFGLTVGVLVMRRKIIMSIMNTKNVIMKLMLNQQIVIIRKNSQLGSNLLKVKMNLNVLKLTA
jgi:hypothetical protein